MRISHQTADGSEAFVHEVPQFGLGVFLMTAEDECKTSVLAALEAGYTHIDTASMYQNERDVGRALKETGVERSSVFITTKIRRGDAVGYEETIEQNQRLKQPIWIAVHAGARLGKIARLKYNHDAKTITFPKAKRNKG
jgi:diketogulonate reductase-like aldo/keto reductase